MNYELGVFICPTLFGPEYSFTYNPEKSSDKCIYFPLPFDVPLTRYTAKDEFWTMDKSHKEPDIFGRAYIIDKPRSDKLADSK
ncbi:hypothetical protein O9G_005896 [Rozella allomycis CSF55]|uniref:Uncharacterized protein n=1 Tax=Rozella allomycis (strain CSF55) TaxID=988480 RepID=A0A075B4U8_ROZAC|nr:hypothetical protein O9G_005896 [Rozella allomycis CSF55]|eukprot:EPZ36500.1 hypothetical protein O9G_005896 [Rozella allomycis CSF55]